MEIRKIVFDYFEQTLFAFLPNICNSACEFCYVQPIVGSKAKLSKKLISNFENLALQTKNLGFKTIRITGGEPLLFTNVNELVDILYKYGLNYTLLTNGQTLHENLELLLNYPPKKITISLHSVVKYEQIFKSKIDFEKLFRATELLIKKGVEITATAVYLPENCSELQEIINLVERHKFTGFKIIFPNNHAEMEKLLVKFKSELFFKQSLDLRVTDLKEASCLLLNRGFASVIVENLATYNCCTTVGEKKNRTDIKSDSFDLESIITQQYLDNIKLDKFPCNTNLKTCPIALR